MPCLKIVPTGTHSCLWQLDRKDSRYELDLNPGAAGLAAVIYGHSHQPHLERKEGVLYLNPGAAGPRRFSLPVSLALLHVAGDSLKVEFIKLKI
jgi:predicted phosphodiesterase